MFLCGAEPNPLLSWKFDDPCGRPSESASVTVRLPDNQGELA